MTIGFARMRLSSTLGKRHLVATTSDIGATYIIGSFRRRKSTRGFLRIWFRKLGDLSQTSDENAKEKYEGKQWENYDSPSFFSHSL